MRQIHSSSRRWWLALAACGCLNVAPEKLDKVAHIEGELQLTAPSRGDAYLFLHSRADDERPAYVTAVPDGRLSRGDRRYVFGAVLPNPYRLRAFLDVDGSFRPDVDVLAQPGAGDRASELIELNLQPGQRLSQDVPVRTPVPHEPPAFRVDRTEGTVELPDQPVVPVTFELVADAVESLDIGAVAFRVSLVDANGDGSADDADGDGVPDLFPKVLLRFRPKPGQTVPVDRRGRLATVVVPLAFNPGPFLATLAGDPDREVAVDRLEVLLVPSAHAITEEPGRGEVIEPLNAIPVGDYELVVLHESGQYWRVPNDLGAAMPSQNVRFRFVHGSGFDAGQ